MIRKLLLASAFVALTSPAFATQCPKLMAQVDELLVTVQLSDEDMAKVVELRQQGEEFHAAGNHPDSEAALLEALEILNM
jgi:hypothetical protein